MVLLGARTELLATRPFNMFGTQKQLRDFCTLDMAQSWVSNLGPLAQLADALPTELLSCFYAPIIPPQTPLMWYYALCSCLACNVKAVWHTCCNWLLSQHWRLSWQWKTSSHRCTRLLGSFTVLLLDLPLCTLIRNSNQTSPLDVITWFNSTVTLFIWVEKNFNALAMALTECTISGRCAMPPPQPLSNSLCTLLSKVIPILHLLTEATTLFSVDNEIGICLV